MRTMSGPYTTRRTKIVEKMNTRPKKGTKFRQSAPHRPTPAKNGPSRRQLQMKRAKDAKANKAKIGPTTTAAPTSINIKKGSIHLYLKEPSPSLISPPTEPVALGSAISLTRRRACPTPKTHIGENLVVSGKLGDKPRGNTPLKRDFLDKLKSLLLSRLWNIRLSQLSHLSDNHCCRGEHRAQ